MTVAARPLTYKKTGVKTPLFFVELTHKDQSDAAFSGAVFEDTAGADPFASGA